MGWDPLQGQIVRAALRKCRVRLGACPARWHWLWGQIVRAARRKCRVRLGACPARRSVLAALFGAAACYGALAVTDPAGPGLDPDAASYLGAAQSLVRHGTLRVPMASWASRDSTGPLGHFPPGFSLALAVPVALGAPAEQAARGVEAAAAFATVALAVWLVVTVSGPVAGALAGAVLLETPSLVHDHAAVLSEPLFLALLLSTVALMVFSKRPLAYGVTAAAASMVRYAAVAVSGAAVLWAFGLRGTLKERLRRAALAAAPTVVLNALWVIQVHAESDYAAGARAFRNLGAGLAELCGSVADWLAPSLTGSLVRTTVTLVALGAVTVVLSAAFRAARAAPAGGPLARLLAAAGLVFGCYAALVIVSRVFLDDRIPFDDRILSPLIMTAEIGVMAALGVAWRGWRNVARAAAAAALALWMAGTASVAADFANDVMENGWDYGAPAWRASPLGAWLRARAGDAEIFSNNPPVAWFLTRRPSRSLPRSLAPDTVRAFERAMFARRAVLVGFPEPFDETADPDSLALRLGLARRVVTAQGVVWERR